MSKLSQKLKKLMKIGAVVDSDDSISYPIIFVKYLGKIKAKAVNFTPFGVWSRPLDGMMSMLFNFNASESNKFALTNELKNRPIKDLKKGEVVLGNLKSHFHFRDDGSIALIINGVEMIIFSDTGILLNGEFQASGDIEGADLIGAGSINFNGHVHGGVNPGGSNTGGPQ